LINIQSAWEDVVAGLESLGYSQLPIDSLLIMQYVQDLSIINGLAYSTIYDQISGPLGSNSTIGALLLNVRCGYLENVTASLKLLDTAIENNSASEIPAYIPEDPSYISLDWHYETYSCQLVVPMPKYGLGDGKSYFYTSI
jgi:hypothetical protein